MTLSRQVPLPFGEDDLVTEEMPKTQRPVVLAPEAPREQKSDWLTDFRNALRALEERYARFESGNEFIDQITAVRSWREASRLLDVLVRVQHESTGQMSEVVCGGSYGRIIELAEEILNNRQ